MGKEKKHKRDRDEDRESSSKRSKKDKKDKKDKSSNSKPNVALTASDFFERNAVFSLWLRKKKDVYFDQLPADKCRKLFDKFVKKWNDGELSDRYYGYTDGGAVEKGDAAAARTGYKWKFKIDSKEKAALADVRGIVQTLGHTSSLTNKISATAAHLPAPVNEAEYHRRKHQLRADKRDHRKHGDMVLEEITGGKATGHEAKMEKKQMARVARAARDVSPEPAGGDPYGSNSSFDDAKRKKETWIQKKQATRKTIMQGKLSAHKAKEEQQMAALLLMAKSNRASNALWQPSS